MTVSKLATVKDYSWQSTGHFGQIARKPIDIIVLHHNGGTNPNSVPSVWLTREASAHYQVEPNKIISCLDEDITAWHCGAVDYDNNSHTIGIEHLNSTGAPDWKVDPKTQENSAQLVAEICKRRNIPIDRNHIKKHKEMPGTATDCSGGLDIDWIVNRAKQIAGGSTATPQKPVAPAPTKPNLVVDGYWGTEASFSYTVQAIQQALCNAGIKVKVDGYRGPETYRGLQKYYGTTADGVISVPSQLVSKMQKIYKMSIVDGKISSPSNLIKAVQSGLNQNGKLKK